jgi:ComF family protein
MKDSITMYKYHGRQEYADEYALWITERLSDWIVGSKCECITGVPIHKKRLQKRGFNQAALLALKISNLTGIRYENDLLLRTKETKRQKELSAEERFFNLSDAFIYNKKNHEKIPESVLIIDDILTTGSTLDACARALKHAGVQKVCFIALCTGQV